MKNSAKIMLAILLLCAAAGIGFAFLRQPPSAARQKTVLALADHADAAAFAADAVNMLAKKPRAFGELWDSHGDIYESACRELKTAAMKAPEAKAVHRRGTDERLLAVTLEDSGGKRALVELRRTDTGFKIVDIIVEQ